MAAKKKPARRLVRDDRLSDAARAAGFVMATPDEDAGADPEHDGRKQPSPPLPLLLESTGWKPASPQRALVVTSPRPATFQQSFLQWIASLTGRAPA